MLTQLSDQIFKLAESPRYHEGAVWFTDIQTHTLYRWTEGEPQPVMQEPQVCSFIFDEDGGMVFGNFDGLYKKEKDGSIRTLAEGLKINDMGVDPAGRILFGTNYHSGARKYPLGSLYRYSREKGLEELDYGYHLSNGIVFAPDGKTMYAVDTSVRCIFRYDYDPETGAFGRREIFTRFRMDDGMPDGMTIDSEGCLWTAHWYGYCVIRTSPEGEMLEKIPMPVGLVSAVEFTPKGLFVTSGTDYGRLDIAPASFDPKTAPGLDGHVFLLKTPHTGAPHGLCRS